MAAATEACPHVAAEGACVVGVWRAWAAPWVARIRARAAAATRAAAVVAARVRDDHAAVSASASAVVRASAAAVSVVCLDRSPSARTLGLRILCPLQEASTAGSRAVAAARFRTPPVVDRAGRMTVLPAAVAGEEARRMRLPSACVACAARAGAAAEASAAVAFACAAERWLSRPAAAVRLPSRRQRHAKDACGRRGVRGGGEQTGAGDAAWKGRHACCLGPLDRCDPRRTQRAAR